MDRRSADPADRRRRGPARRASGAGAGRPPGVETLARQRRPGSTSPWSDGSRATVGRPAPMCRSTASAASPPTCSAAAAPRNSSTCRTPDASICEGNFSWGRGSGTFTFPPDPDFVAELKKLGYEAPTDEQLFSMLLMDVGVEFARSVRDAGLHASTGQLIEMRIHGLTTEYIRETQRAGYRDFGPQDYIEMRIHGVQPPFLRDLKDAGYQSLGEAGGRTANSRRQLGVSARPQGLRLAAQSVRHGAAQNSRRERRVSERLEGRGYGDLGVERITELRIHGVSTDFIRDSKALGYNFTPQEIVNLRIHGVDGNYLRRLRDSGMRNLSAEQIEKLKIHGVD